MTRPVSIVSLGAIVQIVAVICSNPFGLHSEVYISYLILIDAKGHAIWVDDPSMEDCQMFFDHCPNAVRSYTEKACIWCKSQPDKPS